MCGAKLIRWWAILACSFTSGGVVAGCNAEGGGGTEAGAPTEGFL